MQGDFHNPVTKICQQMCGCKMNIIKVEPLSEEEAWTLFTIELGDYNTELKPLAKSVARECAGLPLAVKTMARSMRGVDNLSEWRNALDELKEAKKREDDMEPGVFQVLRCSYDRLNNSEMKECFLYCAFFPEDFGILRKKLIEFLIVEGIIEGKKSWRAKHDKGHEILNKLENACLLEGYLNVYNNRCVKMHDLIRDMAIQKLRERPSIMVKAGAQLREIPDVEEWTNNLVRVSLMENDIEEIPSRHSPRCPKLSTQLLSSNKSLRLIADSFLEQLYALKVLDLSNTGIAKLPDSIALFLSHCNNLKHIPSLARLKQLQKLDLSETGLENLPEGMELLSNLRYLNLFRSNIQEITTGILPNLFHLQVLILNKFGLNEKIIRVTGKEVGCLRKLESLECYFEGFCDFRECMKHLSLCTYNIQLGSLYTYSLGLYMFSNDYEFPELEHRVYLDGCCITSEQDFKAFPKDVDQLVMENCRLPGISSFSDSPLRYLMKLKSISLQICDGIKSLVSLSCPSFDIFKSLKALHLSELKNSRAVISRLPPLQSVGIFSCLKHLEILLCHGVKRLFPIGLLSTLQNLEIIRINHCDKMEEIQATKEEDDDDDEEGGEEERREAEEERCKGEQNNSSSHDLSVELITLPKLKRLELRCLPKLKSICSGIMICDSLQRIDIAKCPVLKRIPFSYPLPSLQSIRAHPKEWWETVEWDQLTDKNLLQPPILKSSLFTNI